MSDHPLPPPGVKAPPPKPPGPALVLPRRRPLVVTRAPFALDAASTEARQQIARVVEATRNPWGSGSGPSPVQTAEFERSLHHLEDQLTARERALAEMEVRLAERERELAESEALLHAREHLLEVGRLAAADRPVFSPEEQTALNRLKAELELQVVAVAEDRAALIARETILLEKETAMMERQAAALASHPIPSHPIPSHPIPSHPFQS